MREDFFFQLLASSDERRVGAQTRDERREALVEMLTQLVGRIVDDVL